MGEIGVAVVVPRDSAPAPALDELRAFARDHVAGYKLPEALVVRDELPLTAGEKIDRRALVAELNDPVA
jgi:acyl-CoA synthetase (AMP-forming)/AMP-acid ligase II